ncbi:MAG: PadR family transcriptional regulator [Erysipelotrichaceae bacterium]
MSVQFKKGVLELVVLLIINEKDRYGYELVSEVSKVIDVNEGTMYPLLKRLTNDQYLHTYLQESSEGPPRKYYKMSPNGERYKDQLLAEWLEFSEKVSRFIQKEETNDNTTI